MQLIYKFRKHLFIAGLMVSMFALSVASTFAQTTDPTSGIGVLTEVTSWVEGSSLFVLVMGSALLGLGVYLIRRLSKGLR